MRSLLQTASISVVSSLTTAFLFAACTGQYPAGAPTAAAPATREQSPNAQPPGAQVPAPRASAQFAQNPAVEVYQRNGASVVNITSVAVDRKSVV
jgi:hypothetical protein